MQQRVSVIFIYLAQIFEQLRQYLESIDHPYASGHRFGMGPNWKIRVVRTALEQLGIDGNSVLKHGIAREVYGVPMASNWREILLGSRGRVRSRWLSTQEMSDFCLKRWVVPRADWDARYRDFDRGRVVNYVLGVQSEARW